VLEILLTALRVCGLEIISPTAIVVRKRNDDNGLVAVTVRVHGTFLDGKSETTTGILETSNKDPVIAATLGRPSDNRLTIASIIVVSDTLAGTFVRVALTVDSNDRIVVGILVASVGNNRIALTMNLVPETRRVSAQARVVDSQASTSLTNARIRIVGDFSGVAAHVVVRRKNLRGGKVVNTSRIQEASDKDVICVQGLCSEHHTTLSLVATIIIHSNAVADITVCFLARVKDKDDRIHSSTLIASIKNNSLTGTDQSVPHTTRLVLVSTALNGSGIACTSITLIKLIQSKCNTITASWVNSTSKGNCTQQAQSN